MESALENGPSGDWRQEVDGFWKGTNSTVSLDPFDNVGETST